MIKIMESNTKITNFLSKLIYGHYKNMMANNKLLTI